MQSLKHLQLKFGKNNHVHNILQIGNPFFLPNPQAHRNTRAKRVMCNETKIYKIPKKMIIFAENKNQ